MADGGFANTRMFERAWSLPLAQGVGADRHVRARCGCCGGTSVLDVSPWIEMRLGAQPLASFEERLRCVCGARRAELEIWQGTAGEAGAPQRRIWMFR